VSKVSFSASPYKYPLPTLLEANKFPASEIQNTTHKLYFNHIKTNCKLPLNTW